jgi:hypothetical protein
MAETLPSIVELCFDAVSMSSRLCRRAVRGYDFLKNRMQMARTDKHVVPTLAGGWAVKNSRASRPSRTFDTQLEAVRYARERAKSDGAELYVHSKDGSVRQKSSYAVSQAAGRQVRR